MGQIIFEDALKAKEQVGFKSVLPETSPLPVQGGRFKSAFSKAWVKLAPVRLWLLTLALFIPRLVVTVCVWINFYIVKAYLRLFTDKKISRRQKCPSCGVRKKHRIEWSNLYECVMHYCPDCKAEYGTKPVQDISTWRVSTRMNRNFPPEPAKEQGWVDTISDLRQLN